MMNNEEKSVPSLSCEEYFRMMDEAGMTAEEEAILQSHLKHCPRCKEEYDLLLLMRESQCTPPDGFTESVMRSIRREKARGARRRVMTRVAGIACAALLLAPALYVLVPHLSTEGREMSDFSAGAHGTSPETLPETLCAAEDALLTYAQSPAEEDLTAGASAVPPSGAMDDSAVNNNTSPSFAPSSTEYAQDLPGTVSPTCEAPTEAEKEPEAAQTEAPEAASTESEGMQKLRALVGDEKVDEWLAAYTGAPDEAEKAAYEYFGLAP